MTKKTELVKAVGNVVERQEPEPVQELPEEQNTQEKQVALEEEIKDEAIDQEQAKEEIKDEEEVKEEEPEVKAEKTQLKIKVVRAELKRNTEVIGQMDPYVRVEIGDVIKQTMAEDEAGQVAHWGDTLAFDLKDFEDWPDQKVIIRVMDKDNFSPDDIVGSASMTIAQLAKRNGEKRHKIYHGEELAGRVTLWCHLE